MFVIPAIELDDFDPALVRDESRVATLTRFATRGLCEILDSVTDACQHAPRLLVLDPAGDFISGDEDSANYVKPLMRRLREIARSYNCTILLLGHTAKGLDPNSPTMRGSIAWIANSRFAYALAPPSPVKPRNGRMSDPQPGVVVGTLVKANHRGAPIGRQRPFRMDASGRLVAAPDSPFPVAGEGAGNHLDALVSAIAEAHDAGRTLTRTGANGVFERRAEFPAGIAELSRRRLWGLADEAVRDGWIVRLHDGRLLPADAEEPDGGGDQ